MSLHVDRCQACRAETDFQQGSGCFLKSIHTLASDGETCQATQERTQACTVLGRLPGLLLVFPESLSSTFWLVDKTV